MKVPPVKPDHQPAHPGSIPEPHFGFCRMNIDINLFRRQFDEQHSLGVTPPGHGITIGGTHRRDPLPVAHRPVVDIEMNSISSRTVERRQAGKTGQGYIITAGIDRHRFIGECRTHDITHTLAERLGRIIMGAWRQIENLAVIISKAETDPGMRHGQPFDNINTHPCFGALCLEKLQPCRDRLEQVTDLHPCAPLA